MRITATGKTRQTKSIRGRDIRWYTTFGRLRGGSFSIGMRSSSPRHMTRGFQGRTKSPRYNMRLGWGEMLGLRNLVFPSGIQTLLGQSREPIRYWLPACQYPGVSDL